MLTLSWYIFGAALILDYLLGDPVFSAHPIRLMGWAIEKSEPLFRRLPSGEVVSGFWFAASLIVSTWVVAVAIIACAEALSPMIGTLVKIVLLYFCLSARALEKSALEIYQLLVRQDLDQARHKLSFIVGREVDELTEAGVTRATVETVAENLVDGVISPLFFAIIGGLPLALAYKMVNTLDSMVGYKNKKYLYFGRAAAKIDDVANFIPARLSIVIISLAAWLLFKSGGLAFSTALKDGQKHTSPNAGYSEAAFAGALGLWLGGPSYYQGQLVEKPCLGGEDFAEASLARIKQACALMMASTVVALLVVGLVLAL